MSFFGNYLRNSNVLTLVLGCGLACSVRAQSNVPQPGTGLVFKQTVRRVIVDVVVRDSKNQPVHGLRPSDFELYEDEQAQRILSFDDHDFAAGSLALPPHTHALPPNTFVNIPDKPEHGPLYVILLDLVNTDAEDQMYARQQAIQFIRSKPPGARFAVFSNSDGLHFIQGFTEDKDLLYAALDPEHPRPHVPKVFLMSMNFGRGDPFSSLSVLMRVTDYVNGLPGRKNLIWMSGMFPLSYSMEAGNPADFENDLKGVIAGLARAQVAVYPINLRGVVTNPEGALTGLRPGGGAHNTDSVPGPGGGTLANVEDSATPAASQTQQAGRALFQGGTNSLAADYASQDKIAVETGGRAFYSDNGITADLNEVVNEGGNYYSISYSPSNSRYDGSLRKILVTVTQPGYRLAYRRSYFATDPDKPWNPQPKKADELQTTEERAIDQQEHPLYAILEPGAPMVHDVLFKTSVHRVGSPALPTPEQLAKLSRQPAYRHASVRALSRTPIQTYAISYLVAAKQIHASTDEPAPLEFAAVAYDSQGYAMNGFFQNAASSDMDTTQNVYRAIQELDVPVNAMSIRIAVRDTSTGRGGALEVSLPLPPEPEAQAKSPRIGDNAQNPVKPN